VSDSRLAKIQREQDQVHAFLNGRGIAFDRLDEGPDPPDVIAHRDGLPPLGIEITEYHPEGDRVGMEDRARQFRGTFDDLIARLPSLKGIAVSVVFKDARIPSLRRHEDIANEILRCMLYLSRPARIEFSGIKLSFQDDSPRPLGHHWSALPAQEWPVLAKYVSSLELNGFSHDYHLPCSCRQAQAAFSSPFAAAFSSLLEGKAERICKATQRERYKKSNSPLWLLIVSNRRNDLGSHIWGDPHLRTAIEESGFDFVESPFNEVWLMAEVLGGKSQRLYPWEDRV
jgi:hypothetical protein